MATPRVVARLAPAGAAVRTTISMERDGATETVRDVKAPDLWTALKELLVLRSLHETEGVQSADLSLEQAVVNRALSTSAVKKLLANNHLQSADVTFSPDGIVVGVVPQLGPMTLRRRQYVVGVKARRGRLELDLAEILGIPIAGSRIAAIVDAKADELDWLTIRRRDNLLTIGYPRLRLDRATLADGSLHATLSAAPDAPRRA